jgi:hypothetical protein
MSGSITLGSAIMRHSPTAAPSLGEGGRSRRTRQPDAGRLWWGSVLLCTAWRQPLPRATKPGSLRYV